MCNHRSHAFPSSRDTSCSIALSKTISTSLVQNMPNGVCQVPCCALSAIPGLMFSYGSQAPSPSDTAAIDALRRQSSSARCGQTGYDSPPVKLSDIQTVLNLQLFIVNTFAISRSSIRGSRVVSAVPGGPGTSLAGVIMKA